MESCLWRPCDHLIIYSKKTIVISQYTGNKGVTLSLSRSCRETISLTLAIFFDGRNWLSFSNLMLLKFKSESRIMPKLFVWLIMRSKESRWELTFCLSLRALKTVNLVTSLFSWRKFCSIQSLMRRMIEQERSQNGPVWILQVLAMCAGILSKGDDLNH